MRLSDRHERDFHRITTGAAGRGCDAVPHARDILGDRHWFIEPQRSRSNPEAPGVLLLFGIEADARPGPATNRPPPVADEDTQKIVVRITRRGAPASTL